MSPFEAVLFSLAGMGAAVLAAITARATIGRLAWWYYKRRTDT